MLKPKTNIFERSEPRWPEFLLTLSCFWGMCCKKRVVVTICNITNCNHTHILSSADKTPPWQYLHLPHKVIFRDVDEDDFNVETNIRMHTTIFHLCSYTFLLHDSPITPNTLILVSSPQLPLHLCFKWFITGKGKFPGTAAFGVKVSSAHQSSYDSWAKLSEFIVLTYSIHKSDLMISLSKTTQDIWTLCLAGIWFEFSW